MNTNEFEKISDIVNAIKTPDQAAAGEARKYVDSLVKPPKSMGKLEDIAVKLAGITGCVKNRVREKEILVFCADNGVTAEGVASAPVSVTMMQAVNMKRGVTGMAALAKDFGTKVTVVDVGIATDYDGLIKKCDLARSAEGIVYKNVRQGTGNIVKEPAMTRDECIEAILIGAECAKRTGSCDSQNSGTSGAYAAECAGSGDDRTAGINLVGIGEMGIGNTTTSTAVLCALTGADPETVTGRGAGITDESFDRKKEVIKRALELHGVTRDEGAFGDSFVTAGFGKVGVETIVRIISKVGGLDIAAMCGAFIGAAAAGKAAVIDGYISAVAALCAARICPEVKGYLFPSHVSKEPGYKLAIKELGLSPYLDLDMGLGEGSGCVLAFSVIEGTCAMMNNMATFEEGKIDDSYLEGIR
ncbi:MAG: nicotinate-nucleotide--dimethylbenzimidazole phosphoribosyltransferase [Butyrivibrio sp.]|nr:nicotinate-nucleotide--dimethylbenzimidazole phosphoribosyltransferase [Butyrivibrio sp.]